MKDCLCYGHDAIRYLVLLLLLAASPAFAEFSPIYMKPKTISEVGIASQLRALQTLEKLSAILNRVVFVQRQIPIVGTSCGTPNAFYSAEKKAVVLCYELLTDNVNRLGKKMGGQLSQQQMSEVLYSELIFVLLHEVGHSLIDEFQLPVLGREEDAADKFASFVLLNTNGNRQLKEATLFFYTNKPGWLTRLLNGPAIYGDEHGLAQQRLANLVCWGFGKYPNDFAQLAASVKLPANRLNHCASEYEKLDRDIRSLLGSNLTIGSL